MESSVKELNLNEMEDVSSGSIIGLVCVLGLVAAEVGLAIGIGYGLKNS